MVLYHVQEIYRDFPGGDGLNGVTVEARLAADNTLIASGTTATVGVDDGVIRLSLADTATTGQASYVLHPGPFRLSGTASGVNVTRRQNSMVTGNAGPINLPGLVQLNRAIGNGLISSPANGLATGAVTAAGVARTVTVATFAGVIDGLPFWNDAARTVTISANASGNPRIDTVVVEMIPSGNATEGRCVLKVVEGTAAASPVAPTLTQSTTAWQLPLANVAVANGAATITTGNLTDRRDFVERSVTAVEADVIALEARVDALEVLREEIVATYSQTVDPASVAANTWSSGIPLGEISFTFHNGYTTFDNTMFAEATHAVAQFAGLSVFAHVQFSGVVYSVRVVYANPTSGAINAGSGTLIVVVKKLVLS